MPRFKIKHDKFNKQVEIKHGKDIFGVFSEESFAELSEAIVNFMVGKKYVTKEKARADAIYYYHLIKNTIKAWWFDINKKWKKDEGRIDPKTN